MKNFDKAEQLLRGILNNLPSASLATPVKDKLAYLYYKKAVEYLNTVDEIKAEESLKKAIDLSDNVYQAHLMYADFIYRITRTRKEALKHYKIAAESGSSEMSDEKLAEIHHKIAEIYEENEDYEKSIKHYKKTLELDPISHPDTREQIVSNYLKIVKQIPPSDFSRCRKYLEKALEVDSFSVSAHYTLAMLYYQNNLLDEAIMELKKILELNSRVSDVNYYLAMCYLRQGEHEKARIALEKELSSNPYNYNALCAMGDYLLNGGKYEKALSYYKKARDIKKEKYRAYLGMARAYRKMEQPDKARQNLEEVFVTNPDHIEATILEGALYKDAKKYEKARKLFDDVVQRLKEKGNLKDPDTRQLIVEALNQRGELNMMRKSYLVAIADFNESLNYRPDYPETYYLIAQAKTKLGQFIEAEQNYKRAQQLDPDNPNYYLGLGILYQTHMNKPEFAVKNYTRYIKLGGDDFENVNQWIRECGGEPVSPPGR